MMMKVITCGSQNQFDRNSLKLYYLFVVTLKTPPKLFVLIEKMKENFKQLWNVKTVFSDQSKIKSWLSRHRRRRQGHRSNIHHKNDHCIRCVVTQNQRLIFDPPSQFKDSRLSAHSQFSAEKVTHIKRLATVWLQMLVFCAKLQHDFS